MALFSKGGFIDDDWHSWQDGQPHHARTIVPLVVWLDLQASNTPESLPRGVMLEPGTDLQTLVSHIGSFGLIALQFPKFADGRAFSLARRLRDELGYVGELRAVGDVLLDQLQFMQRCGFDTFDVVDEPTLRALRSGRKPFVSRFYQPAIGAEVPAGTRPWLRKTS